MQYTPNYNLIIAEGTDAVNPLTQIFPNFTSIDTAMENNKEAGIGTASEVTTGGVHAIVRTDPNIPIFRYTATSAWTTGDTMTLDGSSVTVHLSDGTAPKSGTYVIGAEILGVVKGSLVTLLTSKEFDGVVSFNSRNGVVVPQSGDYTANMVGYNNTVSGLLATDTQGAIDEIKGAIDNIDPSNLPRFIDTSLGILGSITTQGASYSATSDCWLIGHMEASGGGQAILYLNSLGLAATNNNVVSLTIPIKAGDIITTRSTYGVYGFSIFGMH